MPYVSTFDRDKEIEILTAMANQQKTIAGRRISLARARRELKKAQDAMASLKRDLFVCRFGEERLQQRITQAGRARTALSVKRKTLAPELPTVDLPQSDKYPPAPVHPVTPAVDTFNPRAIETPKAEATAEPRCDKCNVIISPRGLCGCPGVRHRQVRRTGIIPGPKLTIRHPNPPPFQMGAEKVEIS